MNTETPNPGKERGLPKGAGHLQDSPNSAGCQALNPDQARRHLQLLDEGEERFVFQTFDDSPAKRPQLARTICGTFDECLDELTRRNQDGAGVFVTVNRSGTDRRRKEDITEARAIFREADLPDLPRLPLEPHFVIETSPGKRHEYLLIDSTADFATWDKVMATMVERYGSDPKAKDRARVLRLAGFHHQKGTPHLVRITGESAAQPYTLAKVAQHIPPAEKPADQPQTAKDGTTTAQAALDRELAVLTGTTAGSRNDQLNRSAFNLGQLVAGGQIAAAQVKVALLAVATRIGLPETEAVATIQSGLSSGQAQAVPQDPTPARRMSFTAASNLAGCEEPPRWLVKGYLEAGAFASLFAAPESLKSFLAIDMGLAIATGRDWHGHQVTAGPVLYLCGEGLRGIGRRTTAWAQHHGATPDKFFVSNMPGQLLEAASVADMEAAADAVAEQHGAPALIIIDTLNRNFGPGDENSTADMTGFIAAVDQLRGRYGCAVVVVHHSGLADTGRGRGSSVLRAALDFEFLLSLTRGDTIEDAVVELVCSKCKDFDRPPVMAFAPVVVGLDRTDEDGQPITSLILEQTEPAAGKRRKILPSGQRIGLEALQAVIGDPATGGLLGAHVDTWRTEAYKRGISPTGTESAKRQAFHRAVSRLLDAGMVETRDDIYWPAGAATTRGMV